MTDIDALVARLHLSASAADALGETGFCDDFSDAMTTLTALSDEIAVLKEREGVIARWRDAAPLIEQICTEEGATVEVTGSNPDFNGLPNEAVTVCNGATDWKPITFRGDTLADCLRASLAQDTTPVDAKKKG